MIETLNLNDDEFVGYLKFFGPSVDDGKIDIEKIGNSLIALNKIYKKYSKQKGQKNFSLKLGKIQKNCTEVNVFLENVATIAQPVAHAATWALIAKSSGVTELGRQFFGTVGQQLALKLFAKGKPLEKKSEFAENGNAFVCAINTDGEEGIFSKDAYENQNEYSPNLKDLIQLEEGREERMKVGYYKGSSVINVAEVDVTEKEFFQTNIDEFSIEKRLDEEFDEEKAESIQIAGKFIDYYGMAHKYHFSFQAREKQEEIGKQKILCMIDNMEVSKIIDLLKPENQKKNVYIFGKATKNIESKVDKIKIEWISLFENYNPKQKKLI